MEDWRLGKEQINPRKSGGRNLKIKEEEFTTNRKKNAPIKS